MGNGNGTPTRTRVRGRGRTTPGMRGVYETWQRTGGEAARRPARAKGLTEQERTTSKTRRNKKCKGGAGILSAAGQGDDIRRGGAEAMREMRQDVCDLRLRSELPHVASKEADDGGRWAVRRIMAVLGSISKYKRVLSEWSKTTTSEKRGPLSGNSYNDTPKPRSNAKVMRGVEGEGALDDIDNHASASQDTEHRWQLESVEPGINVCAPGAQRWARLRRRRKRVETVGRGVEPQRRN